MTRSYTLLVDHFVNTKEFENECATLASQNNQPPLPPTDTVYSDLSLYSEEASTTATDSRKWVVSKAEAIFYYAGLSRTPPRLVYRTSKDVFVSPKGPESYRRLMELVQAFENPLLKALWKDIRPKVRDLLDKQKIRFSSIDVVRFRWVEDDKPIITPVTIWVGVLPDSLPGEEAFSSANEILALLKENGIEDVDVAYRESVCRPSTGPVLYAPASDLDPLKHVIDPLTTALGLPIAGARTPYMEGTMGHYFRDGDDLFAVTARHVLFPSDEGNADYTYNPNGPRKHVLLLGTMSFDSYLKSIKAQIGILNTTVVLVEQRIPILEQRAMGDGTVATTAARELRTSQSQLEVHREAIGELKKLFVKSTNDWTDPRNRIIGHVVWSPAITSDTAPYGYTRDIAVIKLKKEKFLPNFKGNVLDLGPEIDAAKLVYMLYHDNDAPSGFKYPPERLLKLTTILSEDDLRNPTTKDHNGELCIYAFKRGRTTLTTIGRATGFETQARYYFNDAHRDSVELAILPYNSDSGAFSKVGDSGSIIVSVVGEYLAILTGGTGKTESSDITFGTPFCWIWPIIKAKFPGAAV